MAQIHPALESIQFQKTDLFMGITLCIDKIRKTNPNVSEKIFYQSAEFKELTDLIYHSTGIPIEFEDSNDSPGIYAPRLDQRIFDQDIVLILNQIKFRDYDIHYDLKRIMTALQQDVIHGTVDLKNSRVTGVFSSLKCKMFLPREYLYWKKFLDEELAAVVLHELGHAFTLYEYLSRASSTNQALSIMLKTMDNTSVYEDRKIIFSKAKELLKLDNESYKQIEKEQDPNLVTTVVISNAIRRSISELGASVYDITSCEYLADQFATRHGGGKYLVSFMDKMGDYDHDQGVLDYFGMNWAAMLGLSIVLAAPIATVGAVAGSFVLVTFIWTTIGLSSVNSRRDVTSKYDNDYFRFSRIKHQMIQRLKEPGISADEKAVLINHIEHIDPIIEKNLSQETVKLRNRIAMFFSSEHKRDFEYMKLQKDLELIGNNDLYVMSEKLKLI